MSLDSLFIFLKDSRTYIGELTIYSEDRDECANEKMPIPRAGEIIALSDKCYKVCSVQYGAIPDRREERIPNKKWFLESIYLFVENAQSE